MLNLSKELVDLASTIGEVSETKKSIERARAARDLMVANAEVAVAEAAADLAKAKADHRRVEAECAEKLKELDADRERSKTILAEMDELMAIRPMTPEIRNKCMQLMKQLTGGGAV